MKLKVDYPETTLWQYEGQVFNSIPEGYAGFVYVIENLVNGRLYIGKKQFSNKLTRPPLKGKVRKRTRTVESNWKEYFGSNEELCGDLQNNGYQCRRTILRLCQSKSEMSYYELYHQMVTHALLNDRYYNAYVGARLAKSHLKSFGP